MDDLRGNLTSRELEVDSDGFPRRPTSQYVPLLQRAKGRLSRMLTLALFLATLPAAEPQDLKQQSKAAYEQML